MDLLPNGGTSNTRVKYADRLFIHKNKNKKAVLIKTAFEIYFLKIF